MSDFKVQGQLGLDGSGFFSTLGRAEGAVGKFGSLLAGAFSVGAITAFSKAVLDLAGRLNDVSEALSINVEFLQKFINSAAKSGGGLGDVEKFMFEANKSRQAAVNKPGGPEATAFKQLGFSQSDIASLNPQQFIEKLIDAFRDGATPQDINALSEIGGRTAKKLVGGFKEGLDEQTKIIEESVVSQLDAVGDKFTSIGNSLKASFAPALMAVGTAVEWVFDRIGRVTAFYMEFIAQLMAGSSFKDAKKAAVKARDEVITEQEQSKLNREAAAIARQQAKAESDAASPNFKPDDTSKVATEAERARGVYSDSRLAVGGFLGAGRSSSLGNIAEKQLQTQKQSLDVAKAMLALMQAGKVPLTLIIP